MILNEDLLKNVESFLIEKKVEIERLEMAMEPGVHCSWCANCSGIVGG